MLFIRWFIEYQAEVLIFTSIVSFAGGFLAMWVFYKWIDRGGK